MERADLGVWRSKEVARLLALAEGERRFYQEIIAALPTPVAVVAADHSVIYANRAFRQTFVPHGVEWHLKSLGQIVAIEGWAELLRTAGPFRIKMGERTFDVTATPLRARNDEGEGEILLLLEDIAAAPAAAELQAVAQKLAHDLNNPLMIVTGYAEELLNGLAADSPQRAEAAEILAAAKRMADTVARLKDSVRAPTAPQPGPERETILVVDDETGIRELVRKILERERYRVLEAASAEEASRIAAAHSGKIDLLVTDVMLPGLSGPQLARRLYQASPGLKVLYISGHAEEETVRKGESPPGARFLAKPFTLAALVAQVREMLGA